VSDRLHRSDYRAGPELDESDPLALLSAGARILELDLDATALARFSRYLALLEQWSGRANLTAIAEPREVVARHFLDSLACARPLLDGTVPLRTEPGRARFVDVGSGAGFPGVPLKILWPEAWLTLIEATAAKTEFLLDLVEQLELRDVTVVTGRAEEVAHDLRHRERYDVALARGVAPLATLAELLLPLVAVGGVAMAPKKLDCGAEMDAGARAVQAMGGRYLPKYPVVVPFVEERALVLMLKTAPTPARFPRRPGLPAKRPIGE